MKGWTFAADGAPAARSEAVTISWGRGRRTCIEGGDSETWIPVAVIEEIARRAKTWHWEPKKARAEGRS